MFLMEVITSSLWPASNGKITHQTREQKCDIRCWCFPKVFFYNCFSYWQNFIIILHISEVSTLIFIYFWCQIIMLYIVALFFSCVILWLLKLHVTAQVSVTFKGLIQIKVVLEAVLEQNVKDIFVSFSF